LSDCVTAQLAAFDFDKHLRQMYDTSGDDLQVELILASIAFARKIPQFPGELFYDLDIQDLFEKSSFAVKVVSLTFFRFLFDSMTIEHIAGVLNQEFVQSIVQFADGGEVKARLSVYYFLGFVLVKCHPDPEFVHRILETCAALDFFDCAEADSDLDEPGTAQYAAEFLNVVTQLMT
jgi:hypothetical protein